MANLGGEFDAGSVEPQREMGVLPAGEYRCVATESDFKDTKAGTGKYLEITWQVIEGQYANRKLFSRLNLMNPNSTAVEIARSELSSICRAVNVLKLKDSSQIHNIPLLVKVAVKKREDTGEDSNEVKGYRSSIVGGGGSGYTQAGSNGGGGGSAAKPAWA